MILIEVFVPSLNRDYDLRLNENVIIEEVTDEIVELICQKEHCGLTGEKKDFLLCSCQTGDTLDVKTTLAQEGIQSGAKLLLV